MAGPALRVALYWAPARGDVLGAAGNAWLGRDPELSVAVAQPEIDGLFEATAAPRVYGFHATLRPPMALATGWQAFLHDAEALAARTAPFDLPALAVDDLGGFLALRETAPCTALRGLADACVRVTEPHRLQEDAATIAKRRAAGLSAEQEVLLARWGYPYVMQSWRFHMTLTRLLAAPEAVVLRPAAEAHFAPSLAEKRQVREIVVFTQHRGRTFSIAERLALRG